MVKLPSIPSPFKKSTSSSGSGSGSGSKWKGTGMSQEDFMRKDECILLDEDDKITGQANKYTCHQFTPSQPRGLLHRAFSVFLFDGHGRLLLQQRAKSKITFPEVWTNTCCSHPLSGYKPTEVDTPQDLADGSVMGIKRAAVRKLEHELGIPASEVPLANFKFLTRLHYWAADTLTHGPQSEWGEHEIDYILFIQCPEGVTVKPNPDEVDATKYVTLKELQGMMNDTQNGLKWSPWFRIIVERFLPAWWADLNKTLTTDVFVDVGSIHRFDPPKEHMGGGGAAGPYLDLPAGERRKMQVQLQQQQQQQQKGVKGGASTAAAAAAAVVGVGDSGKKQGAYGKIKSHSEGVLSQLLHINEVMCALRVKFCNPFPEVEMLSATATEEHIADVAFCNDILCKVSRSFAAVIKQLPQGLCLETVVFYLVLRALDTVEDDMEAFAADNSVKIAHLKSFYEVALEDTTWRMTGVGKGDEAVLLEQFYRVVRVFKGLAPGMQAVIKDITKRMGGGMAAFVEKDLGQGTINLKEYDLYCHYVAGLVGEGLTRMFAASGKEESKIAEGIGHVLSNSMGLFLQKTNIIRDYLEDFVDGRAFWPQEVWKQYAPTGSLGDFADAKNGEAALTCLDHLVMNALVHVPDCLAYMSQLHTPEVFRFCAIPQVMAIATLEKVYNNPDVFTGVVKIRKGLACKLILEANNMGELYACFDSFTNKIATRCMRETPEGTLKEKTLTLCGEIQVLCAQAKEAGGGKMGNGKGTYMAVVMSLLLVPVLAVCFAQGGGGGGGGVGGNGILTCSDYLRMAFMVLVSVVCTFGLSNVVMSVWPPKGGSTSTGGSSKTIKSSIGKKNK